MYIPSSTLKQASPIRRLSHLTFHVLVTLAVQSSSHADLIAFAPLSDGGTTLRNYTSTRGYDFTVTESILISEIGAFDDFSNGFSGGTVGVRFWNIDGSVASPLFQVSNGDAFDGPTLSGPGFNGRFRYEDIPDFVLAPGTYVVGANFGNSSFTSDGFIRDAGSVATGGSEVTLGNPRFTNGVNAFPSSIVTGDNLGYFGANFKYAVTAVPEPSTVACVAVGGFLLVILRRRGKR